MSTTEPTSWQRVFAAAEPSLEEVQTAQHDVHMRRMEADAELVRLRRRRPTVMVEGTTEELKEHDEQLRAAELEYERWRTIYDRLKPFGRSAQRREAREKAEAVASALPARIKAVEKANAAYQAALNHLQAANSALAGTGVKVDPELRKRAEELLGQSFATRSHGFRIGG